MSKPWTMETFPKDRVVYFRMKGDSANAAASITHIHPVGVLFLEQKPGHPKEQPFYSQMTWTDLHKRCCQWNGKPCGADR